jgi:hypothetical protein
VTFHAWTPGTPGVPGGAGAIEHRVKEKRQGTTAGSRKGVTSGEDKWRKRLGTTRDRSGKERGLAEVVKEGMVQFKKKKKGYVAREGTQRKEWDQRR